MFGILPCRPEEGFPGKDRNQNYTHEGYQDVGEDQARMQTKRGKDFRFWRARAQLYPQWALGKLLRPGKTVTKTAHSLNVARRGWVIFYF